MKISIAGAGAFGSAIASVFANGGHSTKLFSPTNYRELCATRVPRKLGNIKLPAEIDGCRRRLPQVESTTTL